MIDLKRKVRIIGDIDHEAYLEFSKKMDNLEDKSSDPIHIVLCSNGGDASVALAFYERIKMSHCDVSITATGLVASAATLILIAGETRNMTKSAWVMVHEDTPHPTEVQDQKVSSLEKTSRHYRRVEDQWNQLFADNTNLTIDKSQELHKNETYLSAQECLELGIVQEII